MNRKMKFSAAVVMTTVASAPVPAFAGEFRLDLPFAALEGANATTLPNGNLHLTIFGRQLECTVLSQNEDGNLDLSCFDDISNQVPEARTMPGSCNGGGVG